jgi:hypothetical protein
LLMAKPRSPWLLCWSVWIPYCLRFCCSLWVVRSGPLVTETGWRRISKVNGTACFVIKLCETLKNKVNGRCCFDQPVYCFPWQ